MFKKKTILLCLSAIAPLTFNPVTAAHLSSEADISESGDYSSYSLQSGASDYYSVATESHDDINSDSYLEDSSAYMQLDPNAFFSDQKAVKKRKKRKKKSYKAYKAKHLKRKAKKKHKKRPKAPLMEPILENNQAQKPQPGIDIPGRIPNPGQAPIAQPGANPNLQLVLAQPGAPPNQIVQNQPNFNQAVVMPASVLMNMEVQMQNFSAELKTQKEELNTQKKTIEEVKEETKAIEQKLANQDKNIQKLKKLNKRVEDYKKEVSFANKEFAVSVGFATAAASSTAASVGGAIGMAAVFATGPIGATAIVIGGLCATFMPAYGTYIMSNITHEIKTENDELKARKKAAEDERDRIKNKLDNDSAEREEKRKEAKEGNG